MTRCSQCQQTIQPYSYKLYKFKFKIMYRVCHNCYYNNMQSTLEAFIWSSNLIMERLPIVLATERSGVRKPAGEWNDIQIQNKQSNLNKGTYPINSW